MPQKSTPPAYRAIVSSNPPRPYKVLKIFRDYLAAQWHPPGYCVHDLTATETPAQFQESLETYSGLGQKGPVVCKNRHGHREFRNSAQILVHWPTLLRQAADLPLLKPELALFLLGFRDVIRLKSPFVWEALLRRSRLVAHEVAKSARSRPYVETLEDLDQPTKFAAEVSALQAHLEVLACDSVFIKTLQQVSAETYQNTSHTNAVSLISRRFRGVDKAHRDACSILTLPDPFHGAPSNKFAVPRPMSVEKLNDFACGNLNWILHELWVAHHLSTFLGTDRGAWVRDIVKPLGVFSGDKYLAINWELWVGYRNKLKLDSTYLDYVYPRHTSRGCLRDAARFKTLLPLISQRVMLDYPSLHVSPLTLPAALRKNLDKLWTPAWANTDIDTGAGATTVIPLELLYRLTRARYARTPSDLTSRPTAIKAAPVVDTTPLYFHFRIPTIDPKTLHNKTYDCTAIYFGRKVYFQPSWDLPDPNIYCRPRPARGESRFISSAMMAQVHGHTSDSDTGPAARYVLRHGVKRIPPDNRLAFSADVLLDPDFSVDAIRTSDMILEIRRVATFRKADFKRILALQAVPADCEAPRKDTSRWTYAADLAIKLLYRPDMTAEDKVKLLDACKPKPYLAITARAAVLRKELIAKGVYDINELPHKKYNYRIAQEITAAKKIAAAKKK